MCIALSDSLKNGKYGFIAKVFNLPSVRTMSEYNSFDADIEDGIMYDVVDEVNSNFDDGKPNHEWRRSVALKWDAMHLADKVVFNSRTNEITGFTHDAFDIDILMHEFQAGIESDENIDESTQNDSAPLKGRASQFLIFMISNLEKNMKQVKYVIARYACGDGISSEFITDTIQKIIVSLSR